MTVTRPATLAELQQLSANELLKHLRERDEDQWFDRKSARIRARDLADALIAFANAEGGLVAIGISRGEIEGVDADPGAQNAWRQSARDFTVPPVRMRAELVACANSRGDADHVLLLDIESSEHVHENVRGEILLRIGDENRRLGALEAQELRYEKGSTFFDGTPVQGAAQDDLDAKKIEQFLRRVGGSGRPDDALVARGLLAATPDGRVPTVAGILTLGVTPQRFFPEAFLRLLRYQGRAPETGQRANVVSDIRLDGALPEQVAGARARLRRWVPRAVRLGRGGRFGSESYVPESVWLEGIVNTAVHRSYSMGGDHTRVAVFDNRIEIESPGRLPGLVRVETIRTSRFARNPRIARALFELGYGRKLGEGVDRMFEDMGAVGLPDPVYQQGSTSVRVTLLMDPMAGRMGRLLPRGSDRFIEVLTRTERVTTAEAANLLGVSVPTARKYLHRLLDAGLVEHVAQAPQDPHGYWRAGEGVSSRTDLSRAESPKG